MDRDDIPNGYLEEAARLACCFHARLSFVTAVPGSLGVHRDDHIVQRLATEFPQAQVHQALELRDCSAITESGSVG